MVLKTYILLLSAVIVWTNLAHADTGLHWRYYGGKPQFIGGKGCAIPKGEKIEIRHRKGYDIGFAPRLHISLWVAYSLVPADVTNQVGRIGSFRRDEDLRMFVFSPQQYTGRGFDKGHLAPSQDMQYATDVSRESFWMGNIVPQSPVMNRGRWKVLESKIHRLVVPSREGFVRAHRVHVLTGPLIEKTNIERYENEMEQFERKGKQGAAPILKPSACWKIYKYGMNVYSCIVKMSGSEESVSISEISRRTGIKFFDGALPGVRNRFYGK